MTKVKESYHTCRNCQCQVCYMTCPTCHGKGYIVSFVVGLGPEGLVPSYTEMACPQCYGNGKIHCVNYFN